MTWLARPRSPLPWQQHVTSTVQCCPRGLCSIATSICWPLNFNAAVLLQRYERNIKKGMLTDETIMLWNERWELG